jgi:hypothetical protein
MKALRRQTKRGDHCGITKKRHGSSYLVKDASAKRKGFMDFAE